MRELRYAGVLNEKGEPGGPGLLIPGYCLSRFYRGNIEIYSYGGRNISTIR